MIRKKRGFCAPFLGRDISESATGAGGVHEHDMGRGRGVRNFFLSTPSPPFSME